MPVSRKMRAVQAAAVAGIQDASIAPGEVLPEPASAQAARSRLPDLLPVLHTDWADLSVLEEVALRLRAAGAWDNRLGDGIACLRERIALLERWARFERVAEGSIRRPLRTWQDCRIVCLAIARHRTSTFADIAAPVEVCLELAIRLYRWEQEVAPIPSDIRCMMHGAIAIEWSKPYRVEVIE